MALEEELGVSNPGEQFTEEVEVKTGSRRTTGPREPCLVGLSGRSRGMLFRLTPGDTLVGRTSSQANIVLDERGVSRTHARLTCSAEGRVTLTDLGSTNGTFVNDERVTQVELNDGDTLLFGPEARVRLNFQDTIEQALMEQLYESATRDDLTGLLNKKSFLERLSEQMAVCRRNGQPCCLAMVDGDRFKSVNDTYGHLAGDAVLMELARRMEREVRQADLIGRYGGEEFIILIRGSDLEGARILMERTRAGVEGEPFTIPVEGGTTNIPVTVSIGLAALNVEQTPERTIERADKALYQAKEQGRNRVVLAC